MSRIDEYTNDLPTICGIEDRIATILEPSPRPAVFRGDSPVDLGRIRSACAIALHMHQPLIPAGGADLRTAAIISNAIPQNHCWNTSLPIPNRHP